jgi:heme-degrading monooxygenase HmoA
MLLTRRAEGQVEIIVATFWRSLEAIQPFTGSDIESDIVAEEAAAPLTDFDHRARHFDVASADSAGGFLASVNPDDEAGEASKEY